MRLFMLTFSFEKWNLFQSMLHLRWQAHDVFPNRALLRSVRALGKRVVVLNDLGHEHQWFSHPLHCKLSFANVAATSTGFLA